MAYSLNTSYIGEELLSGFNWHNGMDLSNGFVQYQSQEDALDLGLYSVEPFSQVVRLGVDNTEKYGLNEGRPSIRLESKQAFHHGLFIADFLHMPPSECGTWPAYWAYGPNWPSGGEIDIIEGANLAYTNTMSGHTAEGCQLDPADEDLFSGERRNLDCFVGTDNIGCGFNPPSSDTSSYGDGFNAANGGVYAMEWDSEYIKIWHFPRGAIPADIEDKRPDPKKWGLPQALFGGRKCNVDDFYHDMNIVLNINFCGDYGEGTWQSFETCRALAPTCREYVANNPEAFENTYWDVAYIDVYSRDETIPPVLPSSKESSDNISPTAPVAAPSNPNEPNEPNEPNPSEPNGPNPSGLDTPGSANPSSSTRRTMFSNQTTSGESTSTMTKTMTTHSTIMVTIPRQGTSSPTVSPLPVVGGGSSVNPDRIGNYSYIGCFGSRTGFLTFDETSQSADMTIESCIQACGGSTYIGVYEETCYCADRLDANTRAVADESDCDVPCPGNDKQLCGGLAARSTSNSRRWMPARRDAPSSVLLTVYASLADTETPEPPPGMGASRPSTSSGRVDLNDSDNLAGETGSDGQTAAAVTDDVTEVVVVTNTLADSTVTRVITQLGPSEVTTVTRAIGNLAQPNVNTRVQVIVEPDASGATTLNRPGVRTTVTYFTVFPSDPAALVPQESVITLLYEDCDCETPRLMAPPMETKVVECDGCGANGESAVTLTVPITVSVTVPARGGSTGQAQPNGGESQQDRLGNGEDSQGQSDQSQSSQGQSSQGQSGQGQPDGQPDGQQPNQGQSGQEQSDPPQPGQGQTDEEEPAQVQSAQGQSSQEQPDRDQSDQEQSNQGQPDGQSDQDQSGQQQPDQGQSGQDQSNQGQPGQEQVVHNQPQPTQPNQVQAPEITTVLTSYQTIQVVTEETLDNNLVVTRTKKQTIVVVVRPSDSANSQIDSPGNTNVIPDVVPAQPTAPDQPIIPTEPANAAAATPGAAGTPGVPDQPVVVGEAWSATKGLKMSIVLSVVVALSFAMLL
ncbi:hypothetical protein NCS57_00256700 [Fusarium keratoplasticum]|uniref:Uncharacterized protein n=1 Tax=Fusarium keratoplasticum TaxID=1328300 RepID=A0ACC0RC98_9HYPO|nr:hypothetical protein NCS57_00256700 [Fusarium keratoplasticum]KAI8679781.1 hypothetical protein NCS57_00256700 [Fusarium keratoplasticum]KAI8685868.1 hypothetical protein NCS55_00260400 [Fusarium keratoplasticum]